MKREHRLQQVFELLKRHGPLTSYQVARAVGLTNQYTVFILSLLVEQGKVVRDQVPMTGAVGYKYVYSVPIEHRIRCRY